MLKVTRQSGWCVCPVAKRRAGGSMCKSLHLSCRRWISYCTPQVNLAISDQGKLNLASLSKTPERPRMRRPREWSLYRPPQNPLIRVHLRPIFVWANWRWKMAAWHFPTKPMTRPLISVAKFRGQKSSICPPTRPRSQVNLKGDIGNTGSWRSRAPSILWVKSCSRTCVSCWIASIWRNCHPIRGVMSVTSLKRTRWIWI